MQHQPIKVVVVMVINPKHSIKVDLELKTKQPLAKKEKRWNMETHSGANLLQK